MPCSNLCRTCRSGAIGARIVCSAGSDGRKKSTRQQRKEAVDSAQKGVDKVADSIKSGVDQTEYGIDNPRSTARDVSSSARSGVDDAADTMKSGADQAQDAINNPRRAAGDAARSARSNVDDAADSELLPLYLALHYCTKVPPSLCASHRWHIWLLADHVTFVSWSCNPE